MLAELAAANAAFAVIKECVSHGKDIINAGSAIAKFVGAKEDLQRKTSGKVRDRVGGSDLEAFMALEAIRKQEEELKQFMIYCGRPGLWSDWVRFQAEARRERRKAEEAAKKKRKKRIFQIMVGGLVLFFLGLFGLIVFIVYMAAQSK